MQIEAPRLQHLAPRAPEQDKPAGAAGFQEFLSEALDSVNRLQLEAEEANLRLAAGDVEDLHQVMMITERAALALELTVALQNKLVEAYQEIARMQV